MKNLNLFFALAFAMGTSTMYGLIPDDLNNLKQNLDQDAAAMDGQNIQSVLSKILDHLQQNYPDNLKELIALGYYDMPDNEITMFVRDLLTSGLEHANGVIDQGSNAVNLATINALRQNLGLDPVEKIRPVDFGYRY